MGAVPKSKIGPRRKRLRRTHDKIQPLHLVRCASCNALHRPHHVCPSCGIYQGYQVIEVDEQA